MCDNLVVVYKLLEKICVYGYLLLSFLRVNGKCRYGFVVVIYLC